MARYARLPIPPKTPDHPRADRFGKQRLSEGRYTPGQIDTRWTDEIERDFSGWLNDHVDELPVPAETIQDYLKDRTW